MTNEEFQKIVLEKLAKIDSLETKMGSLETKMDFLEEGQSILASEIKGIKEENKGIKEEIKGIEEIVNSINNAVIKIENVHGDKLSALFDGWKQNTEQLKRIEKEVSRHEEVILRKIK